MDTTATATATTTAFDICVMHRDPLLAAGVTAILAQAPGLQLRAAPAQASAAGMAGAVVVADYDTALALLQPASADTHRGLATTPPRVLVLTPRCTEAEIRHALQAGVRGYLPSDCTQAELVDAVRALQREVRYLAPRIAERIADSLNHAQLTARETEVLRHMATGSPNKRIALALDISVGTVKAHTKAIFGKLDCASRTQAVVRAEQRGLLAGALARTTLPVAGAMRMGPGRMQHVQADRHQMPRMAM